MTYRGNVCNEKGLLYHSKIACKKIKDRNQEVRKLSANKPFLDIHINIVAIHMQSKGMSYGSSYHGKVVCMLTFVS